MKFLNDIDLNGNSIKNGGFENLSEDPVTNLVVGRIYYNTTLNIHKLYNGTTWVPITEGAVFSKTGITSLDAMTYDDYQHLTAEEKASTIAIITDLDDSGELVPALINDSDKNDFQTWSSNKISDIILDAFDNELNCVENIIFDSNTIIRRGFSSLDKTYTMAPTAGGSAFKDFCQVIFPVTAGETIYFNRINVALTVSFYSSDLSTVIASVGMNAESFVVPDYSPYTNYYMSVPVRYKNLAGYIISRTPISKQSGSLTTVYKDRINEQNENVLELPSDQTYPQSFQFYEDDQRDITDDNSYKPNGRTFTNPEGSVTTHFAWDAAYVKTGNIDLNSPIGYTYRPCRMYDAENQWYYYNIYDPQNSSLNTYYTTNSSGFSILAKSRYNEYLCLEPNINSAAGGTQTIKFGLLIFRQPLNGGPDITGATYQFSRSFCNVLDNNVVGLTNYGYLNSLTFKDTHGTLADADSEKMFKAVRWQKRIINDYICWFKYGESTPALKFSIAEINSKIEALTEGITWGAYTLTEIANWTDRKKTFVYTANDFDYNYSGFVIYNNSESYMMQSQFCFASISPIRQLGHEPSIVYPSGDNGGNTEGSQWKGKGWWAYGTSMTDASLHGYTDELASVSKMTIHNYGLGGSGIIPSLHPSDNTKSRCMRLTDGKADADLITIEIIPNDMNGTLGNSTDTGDSTFCGNLNQILQYLQTNTNAQIVVLIATRSRYNYQDQTQQYPPTSETVTKWMQWVAATKEVCERNCVQCWDGSSQCGLGYYRVSNDNKYVRDQIHLTTLGAKNLARYFWSQLKDLPLFYSS